MGLLQLATSAYNSMNQNGLLNYLPEKTGKYLKGLAVAAPLSLAVSGTALADPPSAYKPQTDTSQTLEAKIDPAHRLVITPIGPAIRYGQGTDDYDNALAKYHEIQPEVIHNLPKKWSLERSQKSSGVIEGIGKKYSIYISNPKFLLEYHDIDQGDSKEFDTLAIYPIKDGAQGLSIRQPSTVLTFGSEEALRFDVNHTNGEIKVLSFRAKTREKLDSIHKSKYASYLEGGITTKQANCSPSRDRIINPVTAKGYELTGRGLLINTQNILELYVAPNNDFTFVLTTPYDTCILAKGTDWEKIGQPIDSATKISYGSSNLISSLPQIVCDDRNEIVSDLKENYREAPVGTGISTKGNQLYEQFVSLAGTWTIIATNPLEPSEACIKGVGTHWKDVVKTASKEETNKKADPSFIPLNQE